MTTMIIFGKKNTTNCNGEFEWHSHLGSNSGMVRQVGAASANSLLEPTRARWSAWCAQICSATVVFMRTRSIDFECLGSGSQSACRMCQSPPIASSSIAFGPVVPTVQLDTKPVLLSTYISQQNAAEPPANHSNVTYIGVLWSDPLPLSLRRALGGSETSYHPSLRDGRHLASTRPE